MIEILKISQDNVKRDQVPIALSEAYAKVLHISNIYAFLFHMSKVYTYMLIGSISEVYSYVLFDVVSEDVYLCNCVLCMCM